MIVLVKNKLVKTKQNEQLVTRLLYNIKTVCFQSWSVFCDQLLLYGNKCPEINVRFVCCELV